MNVGDLVKFKPDTITTGFDVTKDHIGIVIHSEELDSANCDGPTCQYFVKVKWAGVDSIFFGDYYAYHDIDLQVIARVKNDGK